MGWMLDGVCPVLEVPFHEDGRVDMDGFDAMTDAVIGTGVTGLMFPGFASEFLKLTESERALLTDRLLARTRSAEVVVVASVSDHGTRNAVDRAIRLASGGAGAINLLPPFQLGPSEPAVLEHLRAVFVAVDPLPVVVQYAPAQTGTALNAATLRALAADHGNFAAVKVESQPPGRLVAALGAGDSPGRPLRSLVGYAGLQLIDAMRRGVSGVQPGCSFTELYVDVWRAWFDGREDDAVALHTRMVPYLSYWMQHVELIIAAEKEISWRRGWFGSAHCRSPGYKLDAEELAMVDRFCTEFGARLGI